MKEKWEERVRTNFRNLLGKACVHWERELLSAGWWELDKQDRGRTD